MTVANASDWQAAHEALSRTITWMPAKAASPVRTVKATIRTLKPEEFQGGAQEPGFLITIHNASITPFAPLVPERFDIFEWDSVRRIASYVRTSTIADSLVWWRVECGQ